MNPVSSSRGRLASGLLARWLGPALRAGRLASPEEARCMLPPRELARIAPCACSETPARPGSRQSIHNAHLDAECRRHGTGHRF